MKTSLSLTAGLIVAALFTGCQTLPPGAEPGPHGTMAYDVLIESSPPGARIEADGELIGNTPVHLKIFGDPDGTFHDFGSFTYVVRALPVATNQFPQVRVFGTGRGFRHEDRIPKSIYFDMSQKAPEYSPTGVPVYVYPDYYGPPVYYSPYFYGPGVRFYFGPPHRHRHW